MGEINDAAIVNALRRQMTLTAARQVVAASNLANVNTPGYKAKEVTSFGEALEQQLSGASRLVTTSLRHLGGAPASDPNVTETSGPERRDGNNVQLDQELLTMTRASGDFAAAQTALAAKFRLVRYALTESR
jgi:flagellar basal-body rod protein FlgB